jgi:hypothetical protein
VPAAVPHIFNDFHTRRRPFWEPPPILPTTGSWIAKVPGPISNSPIIISTVNTRSSYSDRCQGPPSSAILNFLIVSIIFPMAKQPSIFLNRIKIIFYQVVQDRNILCPNRMLIK